MMISQQKPRRVKAKITRTVTQIAVVLLDRDGNIEEVEDVHDDIDTHESSVDSVITVLSVHN